MSTPPEQLTERPRKFNWWWVAVPLLLVVVGVLLLPGIHSAREAARRASCIGTFKHLGLAMGNYHDQQGCYPPAYFADEDGRPRHSWRVLVLPYNTGEQLHRNYNFDAPWNDPSNLELARNVPSGMVAFNSTYRCPSETEADEMHATYVMPVGPGAFSEGPNARSIREITDGRSNTIAIAERSQSGIHWMEPRDLDVERMSYTVNDPAAYGIRSPHTGTACALFADGTVHGISENIDPKILRAVITVDAGDRGSEFHTMNNP